MVTGIGDGYLLQRLANDLSRDIYGTYGWTWPGQYSYSAPVPFCQHCWCGDAGAFNGKPHVACCMCGTRRVQ